MCHGETASPEAGLKGCLAPLEAREENQEGSGILLFTMACLLGRERAVFFKRAVAFIRHNCIRRECLEAVFEPVPFRGSEGDAGADGNTGSPRSPYSPAGTTIRPPFADIFQKETKPRRPGTDA